MLYLQKKINMLKIKITYLQRYVFHNTYLKIHDNGTY